MYISRVNVRALAGLIAIVAISWSPISSFAQVLNHPVITEVYTDPFGLNDGPVGSDPASQHQEYIEIYIPPCADLVGLNCNALNLTFYEVEGDSSSSGVELINYRFDLPTLQAGTTGKVVVLGWLKYIGDPPSALAGTSNTRIAMINNQVTSTGGAYDFIAINGNHFGGGVTNPNFSAILAESFINVPNETRSGIVQDGSGVYLLVNRDAAGYVQLCDDKNLTGCSSAGFCRGSLIVGTLTPCTVGAVNACADGSKCLPQGAHPVLPDNNFGLSTSALLDGYAGNNDSKFRIDQQPVTCNDVPANCNDLETVLTAGGAFSLLIPQMPDEDTTRLTPTVGNGFARIYPDVAKTTEDSNAFNDDPVVDAMESYRLIRNAGPFYPTPGVVPLSTSAPELSVADDTEQNFEVLTKTTGRPGILSANTGGAFNIDMSVSGITLPAGAATFAPGITDTNVAGQTFGFPSVAITPNAGATHLSSATANVTVTAVNSSGGLPAVQNASQQVSVTATILNPIDGKDVTGAAFQTTVFLAIQPLRDDPGVLNEFLASSVGTFIAGQPNAALLGTVGNASFLLDPLSNLSDSTVWSGRTKDLPTLSEECTNWINIPGPGVKLDFAQTVLTSAEATQNCVNPANCQDAEITTYAESFTRNTTFAGTVCDDGSGTFCGQTPQNVGDACNPPNLTGRCIAVCAPGVDTFIQAQSFNNPDISTFGGTFSPTELVFFADSKGVTGNVRSGLSNATTSRTFELLIVDYNSFSVGNNRYESGLTDDFGIMIKVLDTDNTIVEPGEFVFLSFSGGFQGADIDMLVGADGDVIANLIFLDLDNLHDQLGILSINNIYIVDGSGPGEVDILEVFALNPVGGTQTTILSSVPATGRSLPRSAGNVMRLTFSQDITLPATGELVIQELLPVSQFGVDLASGFAMSIENDMSGNPRVLRIEDTGAADLFHRTWYSIRNTGSWPGVSPFEIQLVVQVGDADNDGTVGNVDISSINANFTFNALDDDRNDIDGDSFVNAADIDLAASNIPSFIVQKPTGH